MRQTSLPSTCQTQTERKESFPPLSLSLFLSSASPSALVHQASHRCNNILILSSMLTENFVSRHFNTVVHHSFGLGQSRQRARHRHHLNGNQSIETKRYYYFEPIYIFRPIFLHLLLNCAAIAIPSHFVQQALTLACRQTEQPYFR